MFDPNLYRDACAQLRVSEKTLQEVIQMAEQNKKHAARRPLRIGLAAAALCALTVLTAGAVNPELVAELMTSIRSSAAVSAYQEEWVMEDGSQVTALRYPHVSVEERAGRTVLTVDGAETDITDALARDGRYVWEDADNGTQAQVVVTLDGEGAPVWVVHVAAAGEPLGDSGGSLVSGPAGGD